MVKVVFADNHAPVRDCVLRILDDDPRINVVGEAFDFCEAISKAQACMPDLLILDLQMPVECGWSTRDLIAELNSCGAKILGVSFANDEDTRTLAKSMGAVELLDKVNLGRELIPAILKVAAVEPRRAARTN